MRTMRRILVVAVVLVVLAGIAAWFSVSGFAGSSWGRSIAASRASAALGMPVEIESLTSVGNSTKLGLKLGEFAQVEEATANVSVRELMRGEVPTEVALAGLTVTLKITADGKLLTQVPKGGSGGDGPLPKLRVERLAIVVQRDGQPEFRIANIAGTVENGRITGTIADAGWGEWTIAGELDPAAGTFRIVLDTPGAVAKVELLQSLPYVPLEVWEHVRPVGRTAATVTLGLTAGRKFYYAVDVAPADGTIELPDLDVTLTKVVGKVHVEDEKVTLIDCTGIVADGPIRAGGTLNFKPEPSVLNLDIVAGGWDVEKLPPSWGLPKSVTGRLRGDARLEIQLPKGGKYRPFGEGSGVIDDAKLAGLPVKLKLRLRGDGSRLRFDDANAGNLPRTTFVSTHVAPDEPTTLDATLTLDEVDVAELLKRLEVNVPYALAGKVTVQATISVPVGTPERTRTYRVRGNATSKELKLEALALRDVSAKVRFAEGVLTLTEVVANFPTGGRLTGRGAVAIEPPGDADATFKLDGVPLAEALKSIPGFAQPISGTVSGDATFRAPYLKLNDPTAFAASANLTAPTLNLFGHAGTNAKAKATLANGLATLTEVGVTTEGVPLTGDGTIRLTAPYAFRAAAKGSPSVTDFAKLVPELPLKNATGTFAAAAKLVGTIKPYALAASGTADATDLTIGGTRGNKLSFAWDLTPERAKFTDVRASLFRGTVAGAAEVPFARTVAGKFDVVLKDIDTAALAKSIDGFPVRLEGIASGKAVGTIAPAKADEARQATADLELSAPKLSVQGIPTEKLEGTLKIGEGRVKYNLDGRTLGGKFELKGTYPSPERGSLRATGIDLRRLAVEANRPDLAPLSGTLELVADYAGDLQTGQGRVALRGLRWGDRLIAADLGGTLRLLDGFLEVSDFGGSVAGGTLRAHGRIRLEEPSRNYYAITLDRADAATLFAPWPSLATAVDGELSLGARGRIYPEFRGSGTVSLARGSVFGVPATELRLPFDVTYARSAGELAVNEGVGQVGGGRVAVKASYLIGLEDRLKGEVKFSNVRLKSVVDVGSVGAGRVTGRFDFGGTNIRSRDDLTGTLTASLVETSVAELPVLRLVAPYLAPGGLTRPFQSGEAEAKLSRGVFRLQRLAMAGPTIQLFAEGTVTLAGRVEVDVVAQTAQLGPDVRALQSLGLRLPAFGPVPLTVLREVTNFFSNRSVRLHVTGTTRAPQVTVNRGALLTDEAVRFFLGRYPAIPGDRR